MYEVHAGGGAAHVALEDWHADAESHQEHEPEQPDLVLCEHELIVPPLPPPPLLLALVRHPEKSSICASTLVVKILDSAMSTPEIWLWSHAARLFVPASLVAELLVEKAPMIESHVTSPRVALTAAVMAMRAEAVLELLAHVAGSEEKLMSLRARGALVERGEGAAESKGSEEASGTSAGCNAWRRRDPIPCLMVM